jgi:hypothetical protein
MPTSVHVHTIKGHMLNASDPHWVIHHRGGTYEKTYHFNLRY